MAETSGYPGDGAAKPDPLMQEILRLRAVNQAAGKENSRLRADVADREFECQQLDKTIRKLERKIDALEDASAKKASAVTKGFFKPAPAGFECPPVERQPPEKPKPKPKPGVIIDSATGAEVNPEEFWPEDNKEGNILLRQDGYSPEAELMSEMQNPIEVNPEFDTNRYGKLIGGGKEKDAEAMIRNEGGPTVEQMERVPLEVLRKYPNLDPNWCDPKYNDCSLLQWSCSMGFRDVASVLLERKADPNHRTNSGMSILTSVCARNCQDCAQLLLTHRANPNDAVEPTGGKTLLMWASRIEYSDEEGNDHLNPFVSMLLEYRADPAVTDGQGKTALIHASTEGNVLAVEALLAARADVDVQDSEGSTAWQIALRYCHGRVSSMLLSRRSKADAKTAPG